MRDFKVLKIAEAGTVDIDLIGSTMNSYDN